MSRLQPDYLRVPGQNFACLAVVAPEGVGTRQKADFFGIKIRGVFNTHDEAAAHAEQLHHEDPALDTWVVSMYEWLALPPEADPSKVKYQDDKLQELMSGYYENRRKAEAEFQARKAAVQRDGLDAHLTPEERLPPPPEGVKTLDDLGFGGDDPWVAARRAKGKAKVGEIEELAGAETPAAETPAAETPAE